MWSGKRAEDEPWTKEASEVGKTGNCNVISQEYFKK